MQKNKKSKLPVWKLENIYKSPNDPQIDIDLDQIEKKVDEFCKKYNTIDKPYLNNPDLLLQALQDNERMNDEIIDKPIFYLSRLLTIDSGNSKALAKSAIVSNRHSKILNNLTFFSISLGKISKDNQVKFLSEPKLIHYKQLLKRVFEQAKYNLTESEEKILSLKSLPSYESWVNGNDKILGKRSIIWKNKKLPLTLAIKKISQTKSAKERTKLNELINVELGHVSEFSEAEINAIFTDKKIDDELRGFEKPYSATLLMNDNEATVIENLIDVVSAHNHIAHKFYKLKAKIHKLKYLKYYERSLKVDESRTKFTFDDSVKRLKQMYSELNPEYIKYLDTYIKEGAIDAKIKIGKKVGAYCASSHKITTHIMLNHDDTLNAFLTFAHEMGHAIHSEMSKKQSVIYEDYSISLAETASTLFEKIAFDSVIKDLDKKSKIIFLHNKISDSISTIFRQVACFKFELELHNTIRTKGYVDNNEILNIHNRNMSAYMGPSVKFENSDGLSYVSWPHLRYFFYVYTYAYGLLVSMTLLQKYKQDKSFWKSIEQFLSAGSSDSPENILRKIGIDLKDKSVFEGGLKIIENDVNELEKLLK
jgi:oligoendopeptidase F